MAMVDMRVKEVLMPCSDTWLAQRVFALQSQYFTKELPRETLSVIASDWFDALGKYPQWAIERAIKWWKSDENPDRRKAPLEGDISARAKFEIGGLDSLPYILRNAKAKQEPRPPVQLTDQQRAARAAELDGLKLHLAAKISGAVWPEKPKTDQRQESEIMPIWATDKKDLAEYKGQMPQGGDND